MSASDPSAEAFLFVVEEKDLSEHKRLDSFLSARLPNTSRSLIKKLFLDGEISSKSKLELKRMPAAGTEISLRLPKESSEILAQEIPLEILFEDEHLLIVNKAAGMTVHPAAGNPDGTLVNAVLARAPEIRNVGAPERPGIAHRLDKGTSGVMAVAKSQPAYDGLVKLFSQHDIDRLYEAILLGSRVPPFKVFESLIGRNPNNRLKMTTKVESGKRAHTEFKALRYFRRFTHAELRLETGRTHQIRVHLSELLNCPIVNDPLYGRRNEERKFFNDEMKSLLKDYEHPLLHAKFLGFIHPITKKRLEFETKPPAIFQQTLKSLESDEQQTSLP